jgi:hypothetical protein
MVGDELVLSPSLNVSGAKLIKEKRRIIKRDFIMTFFLGD